MTTEKKTIAGENVGENDDEGEEKYKKAASLLQQCDFLLVTAGAGFSADSGLPVYKDVAKNPVYAEKNLTYSDLCDPQCLKTNPEMFYYFWDECYHAYKKVQPHEGHRIVQNWISGLKKKIESPKTHENSVDSLISLKTVFKETVLNAIANQKVEISSSKVDTLCEPYYLYTSNVDGLFKNQLRLENVLEIHGNALTYQCSVPCCNEVWTFYKDNDDNRDKNDEKKAGCYSDAGDFENDVIEKNCKYCPARARPSVLMFNGDCHWLMEHFMDAEQIYNCWESSVEKLLSQYSDLSLVVLEIGCGTRVPSVRYESELVLHDSISRCTSTSKSTSATTASSASSTSTSIAAIESRSKQQPQTTLIRINPDFPQLDDTTEEVWKQSFIGIQETALKAIKKIDFYMNE